MKWFLCAMSAFMLSCTHSQESLESNTADIHENPPTFLDTLDFQHPLIQNEQHRFQMVVTPIKDGVVGKTHAYGTENYYYPASLVKLPAALLLLEQLKTKEFSLGATIRFETDTIETCGSTRFVELSQKHDLNFRQLLKELIVVSDNHFYNALYHYLTPERINTRLIDMGFQNVHIFRAFTGCDTLEQLTTYPAAIREVRGGAYQLDLQRSLKLDPEVFRDAYEYSEDRLYGSKHENADGDIVDGPYDLNYSLEIPLDQIHEMVLRFLYPEQFPEEQRWDIREEDRAYLLDLLGKYPSEINSVYRSLKHLEDDVYKYAHAEAFSKESRTLGKLGLSYGFASEVVFIPVEDDRNGFLLSYGVYVNANDIVNDGEYEYEDDARPFAEALAKHISKMYMTLD